MPRILSLLLGVLVLLCACESTSPRRGGSDPVREPTGGQRRESGGGFWNQLDQNRGRHRAGADKREKNEVAAGALPAGWKKRIDEYWAVWRRQPHEIDPTLHPRNRWPDPERLKVVRTLLRRDWVLARTRWVALGEGASNILVENLLIWYIRAFDANAGYEVQRTKEELGLFKDETIPYIVRGLTQELGDAVVRGRLGALLATFGDESVPAIEAAWSETTDAGRRELARALKQMRSPASVPLLMRIAGDTDLDYQVRIEAIEALGRMEDKRAGKTFRRCLRDADVSVRKFSALYMRNVSDGSRADLIALVGTMERSINDGDFAIANACRNSLAALTRKRLPLDPGAWRQLISGM
ncbi:MAG: hypothetical protein CMJ83_14740 [Planctomycetes bacterium]|nr:hypothetical protein [Planctomycetota bacterium]